MYQHVCDGRAIFTNEAKIEVGWRAKYEASPSSANMCGSIPPLFADPFPLSLHQTDNVVLLFNKRSQTIEIKDVEKRIIVKVVD